MRNLEDGDVYSRIEDCRAGMGQGGRISRLLIDGNVVSTATTSALKMKSVGYVKSTESKPHDMPGCLRTDVVFREGCYAAGAVLMGSYAPPLDKRSYMSKRTKYRTIDACGGYRL
jgi:hypothetical protein